MVAPTAFTAAAVFAGEWPSRNWLANSLAGAFVVYGLSLAVGYMLLHKAGVAAKGALVVYGLAQLAWLTYFLLSLEWVAFGHAV